MAYAHSDRQGVSTRESITVQIGSASLTTFPTVIEESQDHSDYLVGTLGLRYGLTAKAETYVRPAIQMASHELIGGRLFFKPCFYNQGVVN